MSLTNCLTKAGNLLPISDKNAILEKAREFRQQGMSTTAAAARAVTEQLRQVQLDLDKVVKQDQEGREVKQSTARQQDAFADDFTSARSSVTKSVIVSSKGATKSTRQGNTNSAGQKITATRQGLQNFWDWFSDSEAVDAKGRPLVMYHSTNGDISEFEDSRKTSNNYGLLGDVELSRSGIFMTPEKSFSQEYLRSGDGKNVMQVYLKTENPLDLRNGITQEVEAKLIDAGISSRWLYDYRQHDWEMFDNDDNGKNAFVDAVKKLGYDGAIFNETGQDEKSHVTYVAFDSKSIKSATGNMGTFDPASDNITKSPPRPEFYSQLQRAIEGVPDRLATMAAPQWKLWLDANAGKLGVKKDEIEFSGVKDYLTLRGKDKVTREEIAGYLGESGVKIKEVVLQDAGYKLDEDGQRIDDGAGGLVRNGLPAKYANYTVPGGENYREMLITLPVKTDTTGWTAKAGAGDFASGPVWEVRDASGKWVMGMPQVDTPIAEAAIRKAGERHRPAGYASSHFDQRNILAHLRVDDRTDADGRKVLFINEVQSDWGQEGKKKGFNVSVPIQVKPGEHAQTMSSIRKAAAKHMMDAANLSELEATRVADTLPESTAARMVGREAEYESLRTRANQDMQNEQSRRDNPSGIPSAPFVQKTEAWVGLALKHAIMHAASNGYDKVALINGQQAADLYSLEKQVDSLAYNPESQELVGNKNEEEVFSKKVAPEALPDVIGKDASEKLLASKKLDGFHFIEGESLKVGGEGMKTFYDTLVPQVANDVLKKLGGGKVETTVIGVDKAGWHITDPSQTTSGKWMLKSSDYNSKGLQFDSEAEAKAALADKMATSTNPSFDITPAMREKVAGGVPLFSPARDTNDSASTSQDQTDTPAFKKWFGDSKVVDAKGEPLVVYHGTENDFSQFDGESEPNNYDSDKGKFFFTSNPQDASGYAEDNGTGKPAKSPNVIPVYVAIKNPYIINNADDPTGEWDSNGDFHARLAEKRGNDGIIIQTEDGSEKLVIAFKPNQIKSAIGNNGNFDPANNNITESKIREQNLLDGYKVSDLLDSAKTVTWWDRTVGTPYHLAQRNPEFKRVYDAVQNFIGDVSRYATRAADMAPTLLPKLENAKDIFKSPLSAGDVKKLSAPIFEGTLSYARDKDGEIFKTDDVGLAGVVWRDEELRSMFSLDDRQIGLYREFRKSVNMSIRDLAITDMIHYAGADGSAVRDAMLNTNSVSLAADILENHLGEMAGKDPDRAYTLLETARVARTKADAAQGLIAKGYAPLSRYGDHTVYVTRGEGESQEQLFFGMYETSREANKASRMLTIEFPDAKIQVGTMSKEAHTQFQGITPETMALLGGALGLEEDSNSPRSQMFQEMLKLSKSNRSAMKRMIERKGVEGYSEDSARVLAGFVYSNSRQASQNLNAGEIAKSASEIPKEQGELKDHAIRLVRHVNNPQDEASALRGMMFTQYIGGSLASAATNLTQSFTTTLPALSQHFGIGKSGTAMASALHIINSGAGTDLDLTKAMKRAEEEGVTAPQETHALMAQAQGRGSLRSGDGTTTGDTLAKMSNGLAKVQLIWGKTFGWAEIINRKVAFIAAYKLAREKGVTDPFEFAKDMVTKTQYVMNKANSPQWARGPVGATLFTFKKFTVNYLEGLERMWNAGEPGSKERAEGRKAFALSLAVMFMLAGAGGFPFADDLDAVIDGFAQRVLNKSFSSKAEKKAFYAKLVGDAGASFIEGGISSLPGFPVDFSGRLGAGHIIPGIGLLQKKQDHARDVQEFAGVAADFASRMVTGAGAISQGNLGAAAESFVPIAIANLLKAKSMSDLGFYTDKKGNKVIDTTTTEAILKGIGFQPASVKTVQEATGIQQDLIAQNKIRESEISDIWTRGRVQNKPELIEDAKRQLAEWNAENPDSRITISGSQINSRVKLANMDKAMRIEKSAPKEIRRAVKEELSRELNR